MIEELDKIFSDQKNFEIIVVNDGSTDDSIKILEENNSYSIYEKIKIISHKKNLGYGAALKTGIRHAKFENIVITDADCSYPNEMIPKLLEILTKEHAQMVVGSRTGKNVSYSKIRSIPKWFLKKWVSWIANKNVPDINSGLRVFKKDVAKKLFFILPNSFSFTITITLAMITSGRHVVFEPIDYKDRKGTSKIRPIRDTFIFLKLIFRTGILFAPLRVFSPILYILYFLLIVTLYFDFQSSNISDKSILLLILSGGLTMFAIICELIIKSSLREE
jgi:glycosyltransferase involved in cell wall biosynthesis